ncbi:pimeloyl-ACP methyl ester carboxylesterase [Murinocardiopsis flavida]|uniref:Pimeloyl-ACP methyl ester carboxylesterase n=2 Tax=Murinocardiopsis flavida TaxID=645275 RepID=A0A2P8DUM6_9ACTN|nr:pimeloyl-ACP methyl ester carboxylesterase [Murinocardiopsis flavida]
MAVQERLVRTRGIELWTEEFGDPAHPPLLLIMGSMAPGPMWPDGLVGRIAAGGRRVIRYDHRDTGRSTACDFAAAPYTWVDIKDDVLGLLDALGIERAHLVGHSAGGLLAQWVAAERPERVATLTAIAASPLGRGEGEVLVRALMGEEQPSGSLPAPLPAFTELFAGAAAAPQPATRAELVELQVEAARVLHGTALPFDEEAQRRVEERLFDRARDPWAFGNHRRAAGAAPGCEPVGALGAVTAPTLVVEGSHEPVKPGHGARIAAEIAGARLHIVEGMGHTLPEEAHAELAELILAHTAAGPPA